MTAVPPQRLAAIFVEVADTLAEDFDLVEFLHMLTDRAAELVGATAVGLLLADGRGELEFVAASTRAAEALGIFELQAHEGPCLQAFHRGRAVINVNLQEATPKWPRFAPRATAAGYRSVHAFPLQAHNRVIGAMNVFGDVRGGNLDTTDVLIVQSLVAVAAGALMQQRTIRRAEVVAEQLQGALDSRVVIEQAKGVIAQAAGVSVDEAFGFIRGYARRHSRKIRDVARHVVANPSGGLSQAAVVRDSSSRPN